MALSAQTLRELRAELGKETEDGIDDDDTIETVYNAEGDESVLLTAWFIWKRRLGDLQASTFDVTTGGSLMSRNQRTKFILGRIADLEFSLGAEALGRAAALQDEVQSSLQIDAAASGTELS